VWFGLPVVWIDSGRTSVARTQRDCQNMCKLSEFQATEALLFQREKKSGFDPGQFHYAMINWCPVQWSLVVK